MDDRNNCVALELRRPMPLVRIERRIVKERIEQLDSQGLLHVLLATLLAAIGSSQRQRWQQFGDFGMNKTEEGN